MGMSWCTPWSMPCSEQRGWEISAHTSRPQTRSIAAHPSLMFLREVADLLERQGWQAVNLDATIVAERPRLAPYVQSMREKIAETTGLSPLQVNIKCTTSDGMGFPGRGEGIGALAIATVEAIG